MCCRNKGFQEKGRSCLEDMATSSRGGPEQGKGDCHLGKFFWRTLCSPLGEGAFQGPRSLALIGDTRHMKATHLVCDLASNSRLMWPK